MRKKGKPEELEHTRLIAARMFEQQLETTQIAGSLGVNAQTVRRWRREYVLGGVDALRSSVHPGRSPLLNEAQRTKLTELLLKSPAECGFNRYLWTTQLIADLIQREFGVCYHHDHVGRLLGALGFTHQKPARRARERDEARIEAWRLEIWPELLKKSAEGGGVILMADEVGFMMNPSVKKTWAPEAQTPVVPYRCRRQKKVSVLGAVALHAATGLIDLVCDFYPDSYVRGEQAAAFLHRVLAEYPTGPVDVVWDNLSAHKAPIIRELAEQHPRLQLHYLPPYAPDLNASEGVWCLTKHHRMANHTISELDDLHQEAKRHLEDVGADQRLLRSCFQQAGLALYQCSAQ
jgi:transposase